MSRLFAGTPFDRPPHCARCDRPESECTCPPLPEAPAGEPKRKPNVRLRVEKRPRGKVVTVVDDLDPDRDDLAALAAALKSRCGTGGTVKSASEVAAAKGTPPRGSRIELQGAHLDRVEVELQARGYRTRR